MAALAEKTDRILAPEELEQRLVSAWQRKRRWSRTDTARWLNDRSERVLAWIRRRTPPGPAHSRQMGDWLKLHQSLLFDRTHTRLAALATDADRERALLEDILRL